MKGTKSYSGGKESGGGMRLPFLVTQSTKIAGRFSKSFRVSSLGRGAQQVDADADERVHREPGPVRRADVPLRRPAHPAPRLHGRVDIRGDHLQAVPDHAGERGNILEGQRETVSYVMFSSMCRVLWQLAKKFGRAYVNILLDSNLPNFSKAPLFAELFDTA